MPYIRTGPRLKGRRVWDRQATAEVAAALTVSITRRAMDRGLGSDDRPMDPYSTRPTYISRRAFPRPRGGQPTNPGRILPSGRKSRARGKSVYFPGGYAEYKRNIAGNSRVNLTRTGQLRRSLRAKTVTRLRAIVGLSGPPAVYATFLERERPWMRPSPTDRVALRVAVRHALARAMERNGGRQ